jgi:hypothetical protein
MSLCIQEECERAVRVNTDLKSLLTKDRAQNEQLLSKLKTAQVRKTIKTII